jgi:hypothetical protein
MHWCGTFTNYKRHFSERNGLHHFFFTLTPRFVLFWFLFFVLIAYIFLDDFEDSFNLAYFQVAVFGMLLSLFSTYIPNPPSPPLFLISPSRTHFFGKIGKFNKDFQTSLNNHCQHKSPLSSYLCRAFWNLFLSKIR